VFDLEVFEHFATGIERQRRNVFDWPNPVHQNNDALANCPSLDLGVIHCCAFLLLMLSSLCPAITLSINHQKSGPVSASGDAYYYRLQIARDKAASILRKSDEPCPNLENWRQDSLRHSYASYHYGLNKNAHETAEQMGHVGGLRIFFRHYRNRVREEAAREYWAIRPAATPRVMKSV